LVATFPASYLMQLTGGVLELQDPATTSAPHRKMTAGTLGPLEVYGAQGTVWSGKASAVRFGPHYFEAVTWKVNAWTLLLGRVDVAFTAELLSGKIRGIFSLDLKGADNAPAFKSLTVRVPAGEILAPFSPPGMGIVIGGQIEAQFEHFEMSKEGVLNRVEGQVKWKQARVEQNREPIDLGGFTLLFASQRDTVEIQLKDEGQGPILLDFAATQLVSNGDITLKGKMGYRPDANRMIIMMMSAQLGLRGANEKNFNLQGNMRNLPKLMEDLLSH
jgi:hypothetical protein